MTLKLLLLLAVIAVAAWMIGTRRRGPGAPRDKRRGGAPGPTPMLACANCGVHLPRSEALVDPQGRVFCSAAHRAAGAR